MLQLRKRRSRQLVRKVIRRPQKTVQRRSTRLRTALGNASFGPRPNRPTLCFGRSDHAVVLTPQPRWTAPTEGRHRALRPAPKSPAALIAIAFDADLCGAARTEV
jgi:hypothetical protein